MKFKSMISVGISRTIQLAQKPVFRLSINVLIFGFCIFYLVNHFHGIVSVLQQGNIYGWSISVAWLIAWMVNWFGGVSWWLLLLGLNQEIDWLRGWQAHFKPALAKYIPGFIWQYVGKGFLTGALGVPARVIGGLLIYEFCQAIWLGLGIGFLFFPDAKVFGWDLGDGTPSALRGVGGMMLVALPAFLILAPKLLPRLSFAGLTIRRKYLLISMFIVIFGWLMHGLALWLTLASFQEIHFSSYPYVMFSFAISLVGGLLALPVPNGLGIREGMMVYLLSPLVSTQVALLVSVISRLQIVSGEVFCVLFFGIFGYLRLKNRSKRIPKGNDSTTVNSGQLDHL
jgi:glycosyltransferase 2 family protein